MPELSKKWLDDTTLRVMTYKSGAFTFQIGADIDCLTPMLDRINDAQARFNKIPTLPNIIGQLQKQVLASSIYSTNTIEGGKFSEQETAQILQKDPRTVQATAEKRLTNLKQAIDWVTTHAAPFNPYGNKFIEPNTAIHLHHLVSQDLQEQHNPTGQYRDNQPQQKTFVGNDEHGGRYQPPKCLDDIEYLMQSWAEWLNSDGMMRQSAIIRATLAHYYFELIHPFFDGNGRTGRLVEMLLLEQAGYRFCSSAIWRYYQEHIHEYFSLFNQCRKFAKAKRDNPNHAFIAFVLDGMFVTINDLHDQTNHLLSVLLFQSRLNTAKAQKDINDRQFGLMYQLLTEPPTTTPAIYRLPIVQTIYQGKTERTFYRDINKLTELGFLVEYDGKIIINLLS